jgi:hypothetical protein
LKHEQQIKVTFNIRKLNKSILDLYLVFSFYQFQAKKQNKININDIYKIIEKSTKKLFFRFFGVKLLIEETFFNILATVL